MILVCNVITKAFITVFIYICIYGTNWNYKSKIFTTDLGQTFLSDIKPFDANIL